MAPCIEMAVKLCSVFFIKGRWNLLHNPDKTHSTHPAIWEKKIPFFTYSLASTARHFNRWTKIVILSKGLPGATVQSRPGGLFVMLRPFSRPATSSFLLHTFPSATHNEKGSGFSQNKCSSGHNPTVSDHQLCARHLQILHLYLLKYSGFSYLNIMCTNLLRYIIEQY